MKIGDLVRTPGGTPGEWFWWNSRVGIIIRKALPTKVGTHGRWDQCWHVLIGTETGMQTANLREEGLEVVSENS